MFGKIVIIRANISPRPLENLSRTEMLPIQRGDHPAARDSGEIDRHY